MLIRRIEADVLPVCEQYGIGVIPWSPLAGGWLSGRYSKGGESPGDSRRAQMLPSRYDMTTPANQAKLEAAQALGELADEAGMPLIELALAFVTSHPAVSAAIIGPRTMEQLDSQLPALDASSAATCSTASTRSSRRAPTSTRTTPAGTRRGSPTARCAGARRDGAATEARTPPRTSAPNGWDRERFLTIVRVFSGIQPTGRKHLGNYIGAIAQYVTSQERGEGIFCIVDLHATTVAYDPGELRARLYDTTAILLAAGLDPARCILFRQSDVLEHSELTWLLSSVTELGRLQRMHQFRDKSVAQRELVAASLLMYPVLMAADVLAYRAHEVPVGEDQREHVELMRDVARRFNSRFAGGEELLVVPEGRIPKVGARIMDLQDPASKMSTTSGSEAGTVYVLDEPKAIEKKFKSAVTDSGSEVRLIPASRGSATSSKCSPPCAPPRPSRSKSSSPTPATASSRRRSPAPSSSTSRPCASATPSCARTSRRSRPRSPRAHSGRARSQAATLADVRERMGVGPVAATSSARSTVGE